MSIDLSRTEKDPRFSIKFICRHSGLYLGRFFPSVGLVADGTGHGEKAGSIEGMSPYVRDWKQTVTVHPIFSVSYKGLYHRVHSNYMLEKEGKVQYPMVQKQLHLLALLHIADAIVQDIPCLPSPRITATYLGDVLELVDWKMTVPSDRLNFPKLHIWKGAAGEFSEDPFQQIPMWIKLCRELREEYQQVVRTRQRKAKQQAAELAMKSIKRQMYEDVSLRRLWNWIEVQLPEHEKEDWPEAKDLFFASEKEIHLWTNGEIDTLEEIFLQYCETGNSVSFEVQRRINQLRTQKKDYEETFEVVTGEQFPELKGTERPKKEAFAKVSDFYVADAKWMLANRKVEAKEGEIEL